MHSKKLLSASIILVYSFGKKACAFHIHKQSILSLFVKDYSKTNRTFLNVEQLVQQVQPTRLCILGHLEQISQNYNHMTFKYLYRMNSTTFLGNLCQCSITRTVKKDNKIKGFLSLILWGFF